MACTAILSPTFKNMFAIQEYDTEEFECLGSQNEIIKFPRYPSMEKSTVAFDM